MTIDGEMDHIIFWNYSGKLLYKDPMHYKLYMGFGWLNFFIVAFHIITQYGRLSILVVTCV